QQQARLREKVLAPCRVYRRRIGELDRLGILVNAPHTVFVVQVRPRGQARHSYIPDDVTLGDALARAYSFGEAGEMPVQSRDAVGVGELDDVPVATAPTGEQHAPLACGLHWCPRRRRVVDALMCADSVQHR